MYPTTYNCPASRTKQQKQISMSSNDETFLESAIESISSSLPYELRRHLEHLRFLDDATAGIMDRLQEAENDYIRLIQQRTLKLNISPSAIPTTEEIQAAVEDYDKVEQIQKTRLEARQYVSEKVAVAEQAYASVDSVIKKLDVDLAAFESLLKASGEFEVAGGKPNDLAAVQVTPGHWILAKIISFDSETGMYNLSDEDIESNKVFYLPESQVVVLGTVERLSRGDVIYAVYPDTTSFYQATVVQPPRKAQAGSHFVTVNFVDDSDEHGVTHEKAVLLKHVMRPPIEYMVS